jgi:hypothetical protein
MEEPTPRGMNNEVPQTKPFVNYLLYAAVGLSVIVLALCAYAINVYSKTWFDVLTPALSFTLFAIIWLWLFVGAYFLIPRLAPQFYNKWAVLGVFALTAFFWLIAWPLMAARVSAYSYINNIDNYFNDLSFSITKRSPEPKRSGSSSSSYSNSSSYYGYDKSYATAWKLAAAATGISALIWVLLVVSLVFFALACHQHRVAGETYDSGEPKPMPPAAPVAGGHEMNHYGSPTSATPNPEQQFVHGQQYGQQQPVYDQSGAYQQNQYQQQQHQIPT